MISLMFKYDSQIKLINMFDEAHNNCVEVVIDEM